MEAGEKKVEKPFYLPRAARAGDDRQCGGAVRVEGAPASDPLSACLVRRPFGIPALCAPSLARSERKEAEKPR